MTALVADPKHLDYFLHQTLFYYYSTKVVTMKHIKHDGQNCFSIRVPQPSLAALSKHLSLPPSILQYFLEHYLSSSTSSKPGVSPADLSKDSGMRLRLMKRERDRIRFKCLVCVLHLCKFRLQQLMLNAICLDWGIQQDELSRYLLQLGCKARGSGSEKIYVLKAPLVFPKLRRRQRR